MIRDLEARLAAVLSARLPAPFAGRVVAPPGDAAPGTEPRVVVGVRSAERLTTDLGAARPEVVPGAVAPRRVVRLACVIGAVVQPAAGGGRAQQLAGLDALLYALDAPDLRSAEALAGPPDPGFLVEGLEVDSARAPFDPPGPGTEPFGVTLRTRGVFWPPGTSGEAGPEIVRLEVRQGTAALSVTLPAAGLVAGGPPQEVVLGLDARGTLLLRRGERPGGAPFGPLALRLETPDGGTGAGTLSGGRAGVDARVRLVDLVDGTAPVTYAPPAGPVVDELVVALARAGEPGVDLGRVRLVVTEAHP